MKQLTRDEIIHKIDMVIWTMVGNLSRNRATEITRRILVELEKTGVLMLVDDEPKEGDNILFKNSVMEFENEPNSSLQADERMLCFLNDKSLKYDCKIIQRSNTPVYQCKKEVTND